MAVSLPSDFIEYKNTKPTKPSEECVEKTNRYNQTDEVIVSSMILKYQITLTLLLQFPYQYISSCAPDKKL